MGLCLLFLRSFSATQDRIFRVGEESFEEVSITALRLGC